LSSSSDANSARIALSLLSKYAGSGLELIADSAIHPSFPPADLERVRANRKTALLQEEDSPFGLAQRAGLQILYGTDSAYGYDPLGSAASLRDLTRDDVAAFYAGHYGPKSTLLELTGDVTPAEARKLVQAAFGNWTSTAVPSTPPAAPPVPTRRVFIADKPGSPQTALLAFGLGLSRSAVDYPATAVMNGALGGLFASRINMNLREEHGYTYGAFSFFRYYRGLGEYITGAQVRTDVTGAAAEQLFKELDGIHTKPLTDAELRLSKDSIIRSLPGDFESANGVNGQLGALWLYGLPIDYFTKLPAQIEGVTSADAQAAAAKHIRPENLVVVAVGDKAKIEAGLKDLKLGPVESWSDGSGGAK
jgi:zinc protease